MNLRLEPARLTGSVAAIPSKSAAHRLLICAALADGETRLRLPSSSADIGATLRCLSALGTGFVQDGGDLAVTPIAHAPLQPALDCGESGSTLRFLLPLAAALTEGASFTGSGRLPERPIGALLDTLSAHGVAFSGERLPLSLSGRLSPGAYVLPGNVSSQYVTGLLLALPLLHGDSDLRLTSPLESAAYVDMTLYALRRFGVAVASTEYGWRIPGCQRFRSPGALAVEGDWSNAAFFLAAGALTGPITVTGLDPASPQGDKAVVGLLLGRDAARAEPGAPVSISPEAASLPAEIDVSGVPDLLPILAVVAANRPGETHFTGGARLRMKESDRLSAVTAMLTALGGNITELPDGLIVRGGSLAGGVVDSRHDHRIAMAAAIAALTCAGPVTLLDAGAVEKSYPRFFQDYESLGGICHVL